MNRWRQRMGRVLMRTLVVGVGVTVFSVSWGQGSQPPIAVTSPSDPDSLVAAITGVYQSIHNPREEVWIASLGKGMLQVQCGADCHAVGFWDGARFRGTVRPAAAEFLTKAKVDDYGELLFSRGALDTLQLEIRLAKLKQTRKDTWVKRPSAPGLPEDHEPADPKPDDFVYVEELPETIHKVAPNYPEAARRKRVEGTVMVQALVGRDGRVKRTLVKQSVPGLDEAAQAAVMQWVFKPAKSKGVPVAVWIATPIKFSLH